MTNDNAIDLKLESYNYYLPPEQIAERPVAGRHYSRLLVYNQQTDQVIHAKFCDLPKYLPHDTTLVMNRSRVFPCRLVGKKASGGKAEVFILSLTPVNESYRCLIKMARKKKVGDRIFFEGNLEGEITSVGEGNDDGTFTVRFNTNSIETILTEVGKIPIPPYIRGGESDERDLSDYQTVYSKEVGSVAAPTAGLHFTSELLDQLDREGIKRAEVTLHVGMGTFAPVKTDNILEHRMHSERYFVDQDNLQKIREAKSRIAVGTTSLRVLESSYGQDGDFPLEADRLYQTEIFVYPGINVRSIDGLITNFHLPKSTLLMLVSSLIGRTKCLELYKIAVDEGYRFFSYGDAMLILR